MLSQCDVCRARAGICLIDHVWTCQECAQRLVERTDDPEVVLPEPKAGCLQFDDASHTYRLDGEVLPSVTQVLKAARLIDYSMIPQEILQAAAERGTAVHQALEGIDNGLAEPANVAPAIAGYVEAALRFYLEAQFEPTLVEYRNYHKGWRYAGTLDRLGTMAGCQTILDFKTGILLPGHGLQLAAYLAMLPEPRRYRRIAVKLSEDGSYHVEEYRAADYRRDIRIFLSALDCWRWKESQGYRDRAAMGSF